MSVIGRLSDAVRRLRGGGRLAGALTSIVLIALVTGAIALLEPHVPVLSLGVLYLFAVLPVAILWGRWYGVVVSIASMLAFNFFFLEPRYTLTLVDSSDWFALLVFLVTTVVVSELAAGARRRGRESALLAEVATSLLEKGSVSTELERISAQTAKALRVERARIVVGSQPALPRAGEERFPLVAGDRRVGAIFLSAQGRARSRRRLLPALASLLGVAIDRERLAGEALEAEALRRSDVMKTALLRAVSHDLRTPLMAISTAASTLTRADFEFEERDRQELLSTIVEEAERLSRLVDNLLDLSRLQAEAAAPAPELLMIEDVIIQALGELRGDADRVEVSLSDEPLAVRVDGHQIQRSLSNLIENALKYSPGTERVHLQVAESPSEVLVRVVDWGPGVSPDERERIFEPFHRGSETSRISGAGLGLAIARGFAEANGGRVWVESRVGQGATFVLALPLAQVGATT